MAPNDAKQWYLAVVSGDRRIADSRALTCRYASYSPVTCISNNCSGFVRDAEVPGSNPGSPTQKSLVRALVAANPPKLLEQ
jgi:hypothetical protein